MKHLMTCLIALLCTSANAQFVSGNRLLERMTSSESGQRMWAMGYVTGVVDSYDGELFCIPSTATVGQLTDITRQSLTRNSQDRHAPAGILVMLTLMEVFPCKKGGGV